MILVRKKNVEFEESQFYEEEPSSIVNWEDDGNVNDEFEKVSCFLRMFLTLITFL